MHTDEAYFSWNGMHNRQSTNYWVLANPMCFTDVWYQMRFAINVWCAIYNNKLIGSIFYDGTFSDARYLQLLQNVMSDFVENLPLFNLGNLWFQHDGAPAHKRSLAKQYLVKDLSNQVILCGGVHWPFSSGDTWNSRCKRPLHKHDRTLNDELRWLMSRCHALCSSVYNMTSKRALHLTMRSLNVSNKGILW